MEGKLLEALKQTEFYRAQHEKMEITLKEAEDTANQLRRHVEGSVHELRKRYIEIEGIVQRLVKTCNDRVAAEKFNCENMLQSIISQHNAQLADIKKAHKQALMKFNAGVSPPVVPPPLPLPEQKPVAATNLTFGEKRSRGSASEASVPQVPFKKSSDDGNLTKKKSGSHSISVIAPKRSAVIEAKDSTRIVPPDQASFIVSASSSVDSLSLFEPTAASALESFLSNEHEEDEFDRCI